MIRFYVITNHNLSEPAEIKKHPLRSAVRLANIQNHQKIAASLLPERSAAVLTFAIDILPHGHQQVDHLAKILTHQLTDCIRIRTRGGIYGKIWPEPEGLPESAAQGQSQGLRPYFTIYPDLSPKTDIMPFLTMIY